MDDELDSREAARNRRRDRDAEAEARDLMNPGMGKVFKQIQDAQRKAAQEPSIGSSVGRRRKRSRPKGWLQLESGGVAPARRLTAGRR